MMGADLEDKDPMLRSAINSIQGGLKNMSIGSSSSKNAKQVPPTSSGAKAYSASDKQYGGRQFHSSQEQAYPGGLHGPDPSEQLYLMIGQQPVQFKLLSIEDAGDQGTEKQWECSKSQNQKENALSAQGKISMTSPEDDFAVSCAVQGVVIAGVFAPTDVIFSNRAPQNEVMGFVNKVIKCRKLIYQGQKPYGSSPGNNQTQSTSHTTPIVKINIMSPLSDQQLQPKGTMVSAAFATDEMRSRWLAVTAQYPQVDLDDIRNHNPNINGGVYVEEINQPFPEYTHSSYLRMRSQEEAFSMYNYLDPNLNLKLKEFLQQRTSAGRSSQSSSLFSKRDRSYGIQRIFYLAREKEYKNDTIFMAANIFDRYLMHAGHWTMPVKQVVCLFTVSMLLAAKLEQPIQPSYNRMIKLLNKKEKQLVTKESLVDLEYEILFMFGCDFNFHGPIHFVDRYLRLLNYSNEPVIQMMCNEICKFSLNDEMFLNYRPSQIAACSVILSINIFRKEERDYYKEKGNGATGSDFLQSAKENPKKYYLNTAIWNNHEIVNGSGYTMDMLIKPLYDLSRFIEESLEPNRLEDFYLSQILEVKDILNN